MNKEKKFSIERDLKKILSGSFDRATIRSLIIDLREFSRDNRTFSDFADFIAHSKRNKGIIKERLDYFICWTKFVFEYELSDNKKNLNLLLPFPKYVLSFAKNTLADLPERNFIILEESRNDILTLLNKRFSDKGDGLVSLDDKTVSLLAVDNRIFKRLKFVEGVLRICLKEKPFLIAESPCFHQQGILNSILNVLIKNRINFSKSDFWAVSDKLMLILLCELHRSEYQLFDNSKLICKIGGIESSRQEENGNVILKSSNLSLSATIEVGEKNFGTDHPIPVGFTTMLIETTLPAHQWCEENLFTYPGFGNSLGSFYDHALFVNEDFKLSPILPYEGERIVDISFSNI